MDTEKIESLIYQLLEALGETLTEKAYWKHQSA